MGLNVINASQNTLSLLTEPVFNVIKTLIAYNVIDLISAKHVISKMLNTN